MILKRVSALALLLVLGAPLAFGATIVGSPHDLSANATLDSATADNGEVCVYCHTPHAANIAFTGAPLWNKATPTGTFDMYGATIAGNSTDATPASPSLACLSCHDGVSAIDSIVNAPGSGMNTIAGSKNIVSGLATTYGGNIGGTPGVATTGNIDLTNDHPVSITYVEGAAGLRATTQSLAAGAYSGTNIAWVGASTISDVLRNGKVECGSCHDPHNGGMTQGVSTEVNFLRHSNTNSDLCVGCHAK